MTIFLSYPYSERETAQLCEEVFEKRGFKVWSDQLVEPGQNVLEKVGSAIEKADNAVFIFGSDLDAPRMSVEAGMVTVAGKRVIPIVTTQDAELPIIFQGLKRVDVSDPDIRQLQIQAVAGLLNEVPESESAAQRLDGIRKARSGLELERSMYVERYNEKSALMARALIASGSVAVVAATIALLSAASSSGNVVAGIASGAIGAVVTLLVFLHQG